MKSRERVISSQARKLVADFLQMVREPGSFLEHINDIMSGFEAYQDEIFPALDYILRHHEESEGRIYAAGIVLGFQSADIDLKPDKELLALSERTMLEALSVENDDDKLLPCALLNMGYAPEIVVPQLRRLVAGKDKELGYLAAGALLGCAEADLPTIQVLERGLLEGSTEAASIAAFAFGRKASRVPTATEKLLLAFTRDDDVLKHQVLIALRLIGPPARLACPALSAIVLDGKSHPVLRKEAAIALGEVTKGTGIASPSLVSALDAPIPLVIEGVVAGLLGSGHVPQAAVTKLTSLLSSLDESIRISAAAGLAQIGGLEEPAITALIARLGQETHVLMVDAMIDALASGGRRSVGPLLELIDSTHFITQWAVRRALARIGEEALDEILKRLEVAPDEYLEGLASLVVNIGDISVARLAQLLDSAENDVAAIVLVKAIYSAGDSAREAIPSLIRAVVERKDEIAWWASRVFWLIGPEAIGPLEAALNGANGIARERLHRALAGVTSSRDRRLEIFDGADPRTLERFYQIACILESGPVSERNLALALRKKVESGEIEDPNFPTSSSAIRDAIAKLEQHFGNDVRLTERTLGRKGGLSIAGRQTLDLLRKLRAARTA